MITINYLTQYEDIAVGSTYIICPVYIIILKSIFIIFYIKHEMGFYLIEIYLRKTVDIEKKVVRFVRINVYACFPINHIYINIRFKAHQS